MYQGCAVPQSIVQLTIVEKKLLEFSLKWLQAVQSPPSYGHIWRDFASMCSELITHYEPLVVSRRWLAVWFVSLTRQRSKRVTGDPFLVREVAAVDMFPHTEHYELVMLLERNSCDSTVNHN